MALGTFIAGRYSGTYNAGDVGITKDGYELELDTDLDEIGETDAWGSSVIDGIWRGGNCFMQFTSVEYIAGALAALWPYGTLGLLFDSAATPPNPIGILASGIAKAMVLTATTGTPAAATPATLTGTLALLAKNYSSKLLFNSKLREVPVRMRLYPNTVTTKTSFFTTT